MGSWKYDVEQEWEAGSARVEGHLDSLEPRWVLTAKRGRRWRLDLAGGPMVTRPLAEQIAATLNGMDPGRWDYFLKRALPEILSGAWG